MQKVRSSARVRARLLDCTITVEYLADLWDTQGGKCAYSGRDLYFGDGPNYGGGNASVDRTDSSKGYVPGNVRWVDVNINRAKWEQDPQSFIQMCRDVVEHNKDNVYES